MTEGTRYFKVLTAEGMSYNGGDCQYHLPKGGKPGKWMPKIDGDLRLCQVGYHVTSQPALWWKEGAIICEVETRGDQVGDGGDKIAVRECRLLREVDLAEGQIFTEGQHSITAGAARASGSATVRASGSATVRAYDSATVRAYDSATVEASGSATVRASGSATVRASGSATVRAYDSATVRAYDSATVEASGSATVRAYGSATVMSTQYHNLLAVVTLIGAFAAHVDRRSGKLTLRAAEEAVSA